MKAALAIIAALAALIAYAASPAAARIDPDSQPLPAAGLLSTMSFLATPVAGKPLTVECADIPYAGLAYPWKQPARIVVSSGDCAQIERTIEHRRFPEGMGSLRVLLHEAAHVAQGPTGPWNEHDAECRSLAALPTALLELGYGNRFINRALWIERRSISGEPLPYGGSCPGHVSVARPREARR